MIFFNDNHGTSFPRCRMFARKWMRCVCVTRTIAKHRTFPLTKYLQEIKCEVKKSHTHERSAITIRPRRSTTLYIRIAVVTRSDRAYTFDERLHDACDKRRVHQLCAPIAARRLPIEALFIDVWYQSWLYCARCLPNVYRSPLIHYPLSLYHFSTSHPKLRYTNAPI